MYLPDHPEDHGQYETYPILTFLVFLRVVRRLEVVPSNAVVASETVNIRHRVHPSPKHTRSKTRKYQFQAKSHAQESPLFFIGQFDIRCGLHEAAPEARVPKRRGGGEYSLPPSISTGKCLADQFVLKCL